MKICVVGVGAIGGTLAAHLIRSGQEVTLVDVNPQILEAARGEGLKIIYPKTSCACTEKPQEFVTKPVAAVDDFSQVGAVDVVFVCVKTSLQNKIAQGLKESWPAGAICVSFQNGIDAEEPLAQVAGRDHTLRVVVNYASGGFSQGTFQMNWINPPNYIGALNESREHAEKVAEILNAANLSSEVVDDIKKFAYQKTVLNAALCPICSLTEITMAEAMANEDICELVRKILEEARAVGEKIGWTFESSIEDWIGYLSKGGAHRTSMFADLEQGNPTEIMFMNSKICEFGRKVGIATPYNNAITWTVLGKEQIAINKKRGNDK